MTARWLRRHGVWVLGLVLLGLLAGGAPRATGAVPPGDLRPGQSATLLPDGRWLLVGGVDAVGVRGDAALYDAETGQTTPIALALGTPRRDHTATVLPDGTILVFGGVDVTGAIVEGGERLDLAVGTAESVATPGLTARAHHTATLLTDGQVWVAGGIGSDGQALATAERWDPFGQAVTGSVGLPTSRAGHAATLRADGRVWLAGGVDGQGQRMPGGVLYDPELGAVQAFARRPPDLADAGPPSVLASVPTDGATDVGLEGPLGLRVAAPLDGASVTDDTVVLEGPNGPVAVRVVPAEAGRLVFVTPEAPLASGAPYTLTAQGWRDATGRVVPDTTVTFTTKPAPIPGASTAADATAAADARRVAADDDGRGAGIWQPDLTRGLAGWETGLPPSPWSRLPALAAPPGVTALAGQVLTLWGDPLPHVTLTIGSRSTRTDRTGRFLLTHVSAGPQELLIDGRSASRPRRPYGVFEVGVVLADGATTRLGYTVWMPVIDAAHTATIPSPMPNEVVVTTPRIPGLEVRLQPGAVVRDHTGRIARELSITPIPARSAALPAAAGREPARVLHDPAWGGLRLWPERWRPYRLPEPLRLSRRDGPPLLAVRPGRRGLARLRPGPGHARRAQIVPDPAWPSTSSPARWSARGKPRPLRAGALRQLGGPVRPRRGSGRPGHRAVCPHEDRGRPAGAAAHCVPAHLPDG